MKDMSARFTAGRKNQGALKRKDGSGSKKEVDESGNYQEKVAKEGGKHVKEASLEGGKVIINEDGVLKLAQSARRKRSLILYPSDSEEEKDLEERKRSPMKDVSGEEKKRDVEGMKGSSMKVVLEEKKDLEGMKRSSMKDVLKEKKDLEGMSSMKDVLKEKKDLESSDGSGSQDEEKQARRKVRRRATKGSKEVLQITLACGDESNGEHGAYIELSHGNECKPGEKRKGMCLERSARRARMIQYHNDSEGGSSATKGYTEVNVLTHTTEVKLAHHEKIENLVKKHTDHDTRDPKHAVRTTSEGCGENRASTLDDSMADLPGSGDVIQKDECTISSRSVYMGCVSTSDIMQTDHTKSSLIVEDQQKSLPSDAIELQKVAYAYSSDAKVVKGKTVSPRGQNTCMEFHCSPAASSENRYFLPLTIDNNRTEQVVKSEERALGHTIYQSFGKSTAEGKCSTHQLNGEIDWAKMSTVNAKSEVPAEMINNCDVPVDIARESCPMELDGGDGASKLGVKIGTGGSLDARDTENKCRNNQKNDIIYIRKKRKSPNIGLWGDDCIVANFQSKERMETGHGGRLKEFSFHTGCGKLTPRRSVGVPDDSEKLIQRTKTDIGKKSTKTEISSAKQVKKHSSTSVNSSRKRSAIIYVPEENTYLEGMKRSSIKDVSEEAEKALEGWKRSSRKDVSEEKTGLEGRKRSPMKDVLEEMKDVSDEKKDLESCDGSSSQEEAGRKVRRSATKGSKEVLKINKAGGDESNRDQDAYIEQRDGDEFNVGEKRKRSSERSEGRARTWSVSDS